MKITVTLLANAVALLLLAAPLAEAQQTRRIPRVGVLGGQSPEGSPPILALRQGLSELGYVEGETIALEWRWAQGKNEGFAGLAAELVRLKVDIIVAGTDPAVQAAQRATRTIPIVMAFATDPVSLGFVTSLARPGGNITGLSFQSSAEIAGKRLQLLREIVPTVARVSILGDPREPDTQDGLREMEAASRGLSLRLQPVEVRSGGELDRAFAAIAREHAGGIVILRGTVLFAYRARIAQLAAKHRLPTMAWQRALTEAGGLMSYGANLSDLARRAATYVDKILKGTKPADLPVEQPTKFELVINLKTAKALGLTIPQSVRLQADQLIE